MHYDIEQTCISPYPERVRKAVVSDRVTRIDAPTAEDAIEKLVRDDHAQLVSEIVSFETESVAAIRKDDLLFLLRLQTASDQQ